MLICQALHTNTVTVKDVNIFLYIRFPRRVQKLLQESAFKHKKKYLEVRFPTDFLKDDSSKGNHTFMLIHNRIYFLTWVSNWPQTPRLSFYSLSQLKGTYLNILELGLGGTSVTDIQYLFYGHNMSFRQSQINLFRCFFFFHAEFAK